MAVSTSGLTVAESSTYYRVIVPIYNSQTNDQAVKQISLDVVWHYNGVSCDRRPPIYIFRLRDKLYVNKKTRLAGEDVTILSGIASGFRVTATGEWVEGGGACGIPSRLGLTFSIPGLLLQKSATTLVAIDIPKQIKAISSSSFDSSPGMGKLASTLDLALPTNAYSDNYGYAIFTLKVCTASGNSLTTCMPASCPVSRVAR
jgi:hypothetical protein